MSLAGADLDYLVARMHGRFGRLAEGERLAVLCSLKTVDELCHALGRAPTSDVPTLERALVRELVDEHWTIASCLPDAGAALLRWQLARYLLQNLELALRGRASAMSPAELAPHLVPLPEELSFDGDALLAATTPKELGRALARCESCAPFTPLVAGRRHPPPYLEAALEQAYFQELVRRAARLSGDDGARAERLCAAEVDLFHLMLAVRGRFHHALEATLLEALHVAGTPLTLPCWRRMLREPDLPSAARHAVSRAIDRLPSSSTELSPPRYAAALELLSWSRYARLGRQTFRHSAGALGAALGYLALRRVETLNLCRAAAGLGRVSAEALRERLVRSGGAGGAHA